MLRAQLPGFQQTTKSDELGEDETWPSQSAIIMDDITTTSEAHNRRTRELSFSYHVQPIDCQSLYAPTWELKRIYPSVVVNWDSGQVCLTEGHDLISPSIFCWYCLTDLSIILYCCCLVTVAHPSSLHSLPLSNIRAGLYIYSLAGSYFDQHIRASTQQHTTTNAMLSLIDTLIILSGISAVQAGPLRRYTNTTSQISHTLSTGVAYNPVASIPALSLAPIQGITTLPFSRIAEAAAESATTIATTSVQSFRYEPLDSITTTPTQHQPANAPTSFWTFGDPNRKSTVTLTSTSIVYEYAQPSSPAGQPAGLQSSQQSANLNPSGNVSTTCEESMAQTSSFTVDPVPTTNSTTAIETTSALPGSTNDVPSSSPTQPTSSLYSATQPTESSSTTASLPPKETQQPTASHFAYPYPDNSSPTSDIAQDNNDNTNPSASAAPPKFSSDASDELPEVVMEGSQTTQEQGQYGQELATTMSTTASSSLPPGITIVPQSPKVIYITVTDPGVTMTVTA